MDQLQINGAQLRDMINTAGTFLESNREMIDSLNVFPVPDGDTGTNMSMTMQSAVREIQKLPEDANVSKVADALSMGALRGARGNSGVILSQLFRGFSKALKGAQVMDAGLFASAVSLGSAAAYKAVMRPKEGTILTVARAISDHVSRLNEQGANVYRLIDGAVEAGEIALSATPEQLPVLKEAGVVDSGGKGLVTIYRGFKLCLDGEDLSEYLAKLAEREAEKKQSEELTESDQYGYSVDFKIIRPISIFHGKEVETFSEHLRRIGDCVSVRNENDGVYVHVCSDAPGKAIQLALRYGEVDGVSLVNKREQKRNTEKERKATEKEYGIIVVSSGNGIDETFRQMGADIIISGGQTMNPSIETISDAVYRVNARNVIVLPNNSNIILAAQQAVQLAECAVHVIPTKTIPQGMSALMMFDPSASVENNIQTMTENISNVVSGAVTYSVRKTKFNGRDINKNDILAMIDNDLCAVEANVQDATFKLLDLMMNKKGCDDATITMFYGEDVTEADAERVLSYAQEHYPDAECMMQSGGQSLYYYYIAVE